MSNPTSDIPRARASGIQSLVQYAPKPVHLMPCPAATHSLADSQPIIMCFSSRVPYSFFTLFLSLFGYQIWIGINFVAEHCLPMHLAMQPNEGKDIVDANSGLVNQALMRFRKAGDN